MAAWLRKEKGGKRGERARECESKQTKRNRDWSRKAELCQQQDSRGRWGNHKITRRLRCLRSQRGPVQSSWGATVSSLFLMRFYYYYFSSPLLSLIKLYLCLLCLSLSSQTGIYVSLHFEFVDHPMNMGQGEGEGPKTTLPSSGRMFILESWCFSNWLLSQTVASLWKLLEGRDCIYLWV